MEEENIQEQEYQQYINTESSRVKWRNRGLIIILISFLSILFGCFGDGGAVFALIGPFGLFVGLIMFGRHLKPTPYVPKPKSSSGTKEIVKGAVIGGIVAGEAGAVIGATIAKNKLDQNK